VARLLAARGAVVVDADAIAREVVEPGRPGFDAVVERFGPEVVGADGALDRPALAAKVFGDSDALAALNRIVHPLVAQETARRIAAVPPGTVVIADVPLLVEAARSGYALVVIVEAPEDVRLERLAARGLNPSDARRRMAAQATDAERRVVADLILDNSGDEAHLARQVDALWERLSATSDDEQAGPPRAGLDMDT
jgi:dephospho-CoA kinase